MCWLDACVGCLCAPCPLAFPSHACTAALPGPDGGAHDGPLASAAPPPCAFRRRHLRCRTRSLSAPALATAYRLRGRGLTCVVCVVSLRIQPPPRFHPVRAQALSLEHGGWGGGAFLRLVSPFLHRESGRLRSLCWDGNMYIILYTLYSKCDRHGPLTRSPISPDRSE